MEEPRILQCRDLRIFSTDPYKIRDIVEKHGTDFYDFLMYKDEDAIKFWRQFVEDKHIKNVIELGIYRGGSLPFIADITGAEKLVGVDINVTIPSFIEIISNSKFKDIIEMEFSTDQRDANKLNAIVERMNGGLDLVIDDVSHFLKHTRRSFEILFPKLNPGGYYVIEDYSWAHLERFQADCPEVYRTQKAMSQIIMELTALVASRKDIIPRIEIEYNTIAIERGPAELPNNFTIQDYQKTWAPFNHGALKALQNI